MARHRVFRTRVEAPTCNRHRVAGRTVVFEKTPDADVNVCIDGTIIGHLNSDIGRQVASALDRGQSFIATIEKTSVVYDAAFKETGTHLDLKVEYLLEKGQLPIEAPRSWRVLPATNSFFTKVAGISHEGRQQLAARCSVGERLVLVRDPDNAFDKGAIKILRSNGEQLGFIPAHVSRHGDPSGLAHRMDHGSQYRSEIKDITGGGDKSFGVNIEIKEMTEPEDYEALVQRRIKELTGSSHQLV